MGRITPKTLFILGGIFVFIGFIVPFVFVISKEAMPIWTAFIVYPLSVLGLAMGIIGSAMYMKSKKDNENRY